MKTKSNPSFKTWAGRSVLLRSLIIGLCGTAFTACNQKENMTLNEENGEAATLQIGANVAQLTKATDAGFELKDTLGLYAVKWQDVTTPDTLRSTTNHADNVWFRLESNVENWKPEHTIYFPADNNKIDLYAYYPYRKPAFGNGTQINLNVATNQTDSVDYTRSDFMVAKTPGVKRTPNKVLLSFEHKLSQMTIELKPGTGFSFADLKNAEVKIVNAITDATYDLAAMNTTPTVEDPEHRTVPVAGATRADVTPHGTWYQKGDTTLAGKMAILVPQTLGANTYIQVTLGSRKFNFKSDNINLNSGCSRRFTLTLSNTGLDITTVIIPWDNCPPVTGEAEEEFELDTIAKIVTTQQLISLGILRTDDIIVDWGDGKKEMNIFSHQYTNKSEHTILFFGKDTTLKNLICYGRNIKELNIDKSIGLIVLDCNNNQIKTLNLDKNISLSKLYCADNQLSTLNVSKNTKLTIFTCAYNTISELYLHKNTRLTEIDCFKNQLTTLDLSQNSELVDLKCYENQLTTLDLSKNTNLVRLNCCKNQLSSIEISQNTNLSDFRCSDNNLSILNTDNNQELTEIDCFNNRLTTLNFNKNTKLVKLNCSNNQIDSLNIGNSANLYQINLTSNPLIANSMSMLFIANALQNRTGIYKGTLTISNPTAAAQIKSITDTKNWEIK